MNLKHTFFTFSLLLAWAGHVQAALPPAPASLQASPGNAAVGLAWAASTDPTVTAYQVHSATVTLPNTYTSFSDITVTAPQTSYLDRLLNNGQAYAYTISAVSPSGEGPRSATLTAFPAVAPLAPTGLTATASTLPATQVQLAWSAAVAETFPLAGYAVYRSVSPAVQGNALGFSAAASFTDATLNTLSAFGSYYYQVAGVDQKGNTGAVSAPLQVSLLFAGAPAQPSGLSVTVQDGQVMLLWNPVALAEGYQINLLKLSDNTQNVFNANTLTAFALTLPNTGDAYLVSVAAVSGGTLGERALQTFQTLPPAVNGLSIFSGNGYVQLTWPQPAPGIDLLGFAVYGDTSNASTLLASLGTTQTAFVFPTSATNFYGVRARNIWGESPQMLTVTAAPTGTLAAPPLALSTQLGTSQTLQLAWAPNPSLDALTGYRLHALDGPFATQDLPASTTGTSVAGLTNGQTYRFFLTALNAGGESPASATLTASPMAAPVNFAVQVKSNTALLTWDQGATPSGVAAFSLFHRASALSAWVPLTQTAQTAFPVGGLASGDHAFLLTAANALGDSLPDALAASKTASVAQPFFPPDAINLLPGSRQVQITWRKAAGTVNSYNLYRSTVPGASGPPMFSNIAAKETFLIDTTGLSNKVAYFYSMSTVVDAGESTRSAEFSVIPYLASSLPGEAVIRTGHERRRINLAWNASTPGDYPIIGYNLYRSTNGGSTFTLLGNSPTVQAASTSDPAYAYTDLDIQYGTLYIYRIHALDLDADHQIRHEGPAYPLARVQIDFPDNRLDVLRNAINPARGETAPVALSLVQPGRAWIKIYNLAGEHIRTLWDQDVAQGYSPDFPFLLALEWDGKNSRGETVASGVYLIHAEGQSHYHQSRKIAVIK